MSQKTTEAVPQFIEDIKEKNKKERDGEKKRRPRISISTRLFISVMGMVLVFIITIIIVDSRLMNAMYMFSTAWKLWGLGDSVNILYEDFDETRFLKELAKLEKEYSISIELYNTDDQLVYSSDADPREYGEHTDQTLAHKFEVLASSDIGINRHFEIQRDLKSSFHMEYIVFITSLENDYTMKGYKMKTPMDEGAQVAVQFVVYTAIGLIFVAAIIIRIFSMKFTKPLKDISAITQKMADLDFSQRCPPCNSREIAILSENINEMSESLSAALEDLQQKNRKLMDDYEKEKTLEHLRYDFITGVSHELKTPIAIIQGYAEGMEMFADTDPETAKQYAGIIIRETGKMNALVMKLLEIIKYDSGDYVINKETFDVYDLVQDWFSRDENLLREQGISYENNISPGLTGVGDVMLISSVVNNYLSNGVSHIDGEKKLRAWCDDLGGVYRVSIFNTGKPIEIKDIDKIWSSFYRADKSMSRKEGRFGLGLTIVASIQRLHGMAYGVENQSDGVRFWFDIEKAD